MFEYDIPPDANPAQVYGTVEFERERLSRVPVPVRRAVEEGERLTPSEALARFRATYRRLHPVNAFGVFGGKVVLKPAVEPEPAPVVATRPEPAFLHVATEAEHERDWLVFPLVRLTCDQIIKETALHFGISRTDILSQRRQAKLVLPRQIAMYLCKELTIRSYPWIGRRFSGRDHTTVLHAVQKIQSMLGSAEHAETAQHVATLRAKLESLPLSKDTAPACLEEAE